MQLRDYQITAVNQIYEAWQTVQNVCYQSSTGSGKTATFSYIINQWPRPALICAHRTELVSQTSLTLARYGVRHNIIAPRNTIREIITLHMDEYGKSYYDTQAYKYVAGVDTLLNRDPKQITSWQIDLLVQDEAHHVTRDNKWGKIAAMFPKAKGLYPTATPLRADGKGLGRHADGVIDRLITGIPMRELIYQGYLSDYKIIAPPNNLDLSNVAITASGDYSPRPLAEAVGDARIVGNVVEHYRKFAEGELGITFAVNIQSSHEIANAYRAAGIPAETVSSKTPPLARASIMRRFRNREILQLVNVDILGEGVDVPAVTVVSMCRPTASYNIYIQQFGRCLRPSEGKTHGILIDHVNNYTRHGLPDASRIWTLDRRERRGRSATQEEPLKTCLNTSCMVVYPRILRECPQCGFYTPPRERSTPEQVDGDLRELDESVLAAMRGEIARIDGAVRVPQGVSTIAQLGIAKNHTARQEAQRELRTAIAQWAGYYHAAGKSDSEIHRIFYFKFGIDVLTAQTLGVTEANKLLERILTAPAV